MDTFMTVLYIVMVICLCWVVHLEFKYDSEEIDRRFDKIRKGGDLDK